MAAILNSSHSPLYYDRIETGTKPKQTKTGYPGRTLGSGVGSCGTGSNQHPHLALLVSLPRDSSLVTKIFPSRQENRQLLNVIKFYS